MFDLPVSNSVKRIQTFLDQNFDHLVVLPNVYIPQLAEVPLAKNGCLAVECFEHLGQILHCHIVLGEVQLLKGAIQVAHEVGEDFLCRKELITAQIQALNRLIVQQQIECHVPLFYCFSQAQINQGKLCEHLIFEKSLKKL